MYLGETVLSVKYSTLKSLHNAAGTEGGEGLEQYMVKIAEFRLIFQDSLSDFWGLEAELRLFSNPFSVSVEDAPQELQTEHTDL